MFLVSEPLRVFVAHNAPSHYSCYVRGTLPLRVLKGRGLVEFVVSPFYPHSAVFLQSALAADLMLAINADSPEWLDFMGHLQKIGKRVIVDYDDDRWNIDPMNPAYRELGRHDVVARDPASGGKFKLWTDGFDNFVVRRNALSVDLTEQIIRDADALCTTTPRLGEELAQFNRTTYSIPNCVDLSVWKPVQVIHESFRIGWQGGHSHKVDMRMAAPQIGRFLAETPGADIFLMGEAPVELKDRLPAKQVTYQPWLNRDAYPYVMMTAGLDLGIAPLAHNKFNEGKSALKWNEYSAMGVPCAASFVPPYSDYIKSGEDGWLIPDDGWYKFLKWAYANRGEVKEMGKRAYLRQARDFDIETRAADWLRMFREVLDRPQTNRFRAPRRNVRLGGTVVIR